MKKLTVLIVSLLLLLSMAGCQNADTPAPIDDSVAQADSSHMESPHTDGQATEPMPQGTVERFTHGALTLEISNVCEVGAKEGIMDDGERYELAEYICYPGAVLRVVDADMSDPAFAEDGKAHPQWGLYDFETDSRTKLTDGMEPIALDETVDGVYHLESSQFVLSFAYRNDA